MRKRKQSGSSKSSTEKKMSNNNVAQGEEDVRGKSPNLDSRYGEIGIPAVAAALQFKCEAKNPAYAPVVPQPDKRLADLAA
jgi:hypothetical protein